MEKLVGCERLWRTAICAIARDEGLYIAEWIALHRVLGFSHIFLYDNNSVDNTVAIAAQWPQFVTVTPWPDRPGEKAQPTAYAHFLREHATSYEWIIALDCDEMVCFKKHDTVHAFLNDVAGHSAVGVNWRIFGDSGHKHYDTALMIERFTKASVEDFGTNHIIKTIVRSGVVADFGIHSPVLREGHLLVSASGRTLRQAPAVRQDAVEHDIVSINHYFTKSYGEWSRKRTRGMADMPPDHPGRIRDEGHFTYNNRNDIIETSILRFIPKVRAELARHDTISKTIKAST